MANPGMSKHEHTTKPRQKEWRVTFTVYAGPSFTEDDIIDAVATALDGDKPLSRHLDAVLITAEAL